MPTDAPPRLLRLSEVTGLTSLKPAALYARIARNEFPRPVNISSRCSAWIESEVTAWTNALPRGVGRRPATPNHERRPEPTSA